MTAELAEHVAVGALLHNRLLHHGRVQDLEGNAGQPAEALQLAGSHLRYAGQLVQDAFEPLIELDGATEVALHLHGADIGPLGQGDEPVQPDVHVGAGAPAS